MKSLVTFVLLMTVLVTNSMANNARIKKAIFKQQQEGIWTVSVTLSHWDEGWKHYADEWRVVNAESGAVLGVRKLAHPHVDEQPFTRSLSNVSIPLDVKKIYIEGYDTVHGWSPHRLKVDMSVEKGGRYEIKR